MAVPAAMRSDVLARDGHRCVYCGATPGDGAKLHADHVIPESKGGATHPGNLVAACSTCNLGKGASRLPEASQEYVGQHLVNAALALKAVLEEQRQDTQAEEQAIRQFDDAWRTLSSKLPLRDGEA